MAALWAKIDFVEGALSNGAIFGLVPFLLIFLLTLPLTFVAQLRKIYLRVIAFAFVGVFLGMFTGGSKDSVTAAMLPAAITLISGLAAYLFEKKASKEIETVLPAMIIAMIVCASFGAYYAANLRTLSVRKENDIVLEADKSKLNHAQIDITLNRAKLCTQMFSDDPEMRRGCLELLKLPK